MEKIICFLTPPAGADTADLSARLRGEIVNSLQDDGAPACGWIPALG
jgi:hypothetical protein